MSNFFIKNLSGANINPATEGTLVNINSDVADIATKTATLATNTSTFATNTATVASNTARILHSKQASMANSIPVAIASNQTVPVFGNMKFDTSTTMSANAVDPLFFLRKIVKQLEPMSTMDSAKRQRITIDSSNGLVIQTTTVVSTLAGYDQKMFQYSSRDTFARNIRTRLKFS